MSKALAVCHGCFGRATIYQLNRPMNTHAHREGHLLFHLDGAPGNLFVHGHACALAGDTIVAVNPWEPHDFRPGDFDLGARFLVLYVNPGWFMAGERVRGPLLRFGVSVMTRTAAIEHQIRTVEALLMGAEPFVSLGAEIHRLTEACFLQSHAAAAHSPRDREAVGVTDFRVRKSIRLMSESVGGEIELDRLARDSGLSRPHFYKLFRKQTGVTPNLYLNTLLMEKALDTLIRTDRPVADIGYDLGFSSQSGFTRFFVHNVGMAPSDYRRVAQVV